MSERNPWKTLSSRSVYRNPWMHVREDAVVQPGGEEGIYGVVETKIAAGIVALDDSNCVYLVGQYRYPISCYSWEIIEGGVETAESPLEGAKRELREEAGLVAAGWEPLGGKVYLSNCITSEEAHFFVARGLSQVSAEPDPSEVLKIKKLKFDECLRMIDSGEITDAMSIIGILRAERLIYGKSRG